MAHETHHETGHSHTDLNTRPNTSSRSAFWFVLLMVGLFVASVNFVTIMGHAEDEGHGDGHAPAHAPREATVNQTLHGETGLGKEAENTTQHHGTNAAEDSATMEGHSH